MPPGPPLAALIRQMTPESETVPDDELLDRYAKSRDQSAFELLVWRHGAMVWGVCRRILAPDRDAAEDACQAAFVALASHASRVRHRQAIAAWLHRVAVRAALDVLATRRAMESLSNEIPDLADHQPGPDEIAANREVQSFLDAGLNRLPDMLRIPFVMCELEGRSNAEAAATLGCPIGTVESRLTRARRRLRGWLVARGVTPAALGAASAVPDSVRAAMIRAGTLRDAIHPAIRVLADRAVRSALGAKLGTAIALAMVLAATVAGFGLPTGGLPESPDPDNPLPQPNDKAKPVTAGRVDAEGVPLPPGAVARLGSSRLRHGGAVWDIVYSPDRTRIASCGNDQTVRVWDGKTGRQICLTRWTDGRLACVRFTADGKTLIVAGNEDKKPPAIWQIDPTTGAVLARRKLSLAQEYVGYNLSPDGTRIAVCDTIAKAVRVFETTADRELWRAGVGDIAWSDPAFALDGRTLAVVSRNRIYLFDSAGKEAGKLEVDVHPDACLSHVALSPDGSRVAACWSVRGFHLAVWNRTTGQIVWSRQTEPNSNAPQAFSPDGKWLLRVGFGDEGQRAAMLINAADGTDKAVFPQWDVPCCARFRSDGVVAVGGHEGTIRLYDPASGKPLTPSPDPPDGVQLHRFSSDGRTLFGWSEGWYAWDVPTGKQQRFEIETDGYDDVSPDGTRFARFAGEKDTARLEIGDIRTGKIIHTHRAPEFGDVSPWPRFTPDGKGVIGSLGVDGTTRVWAVDTGKEMVRFTQEHRQPGANAISADGRVFAAIDHMDPDPAHSIRVCDLRTG
ncbi:MAG TPA: sigma-70 family RNA polymerase sigma factor, partial [Gemmata sp.]|nr:sigma-70 family RNA polymerase sigma factor [Gemmata sp.]